jgi:predicted RNA-binding Zn-ribbon protein involved in translation (DUF1610 family)
MSTFGCDECGWSGDNPVKVISVYICPNCGNTIAQDVDAAKAHAFVQKKLRELDELPGGGK